jgi:hypothetical protein
LTQLYIRRERKGITDTADLDNYLAFTPWKDRNHYRLYKRAVAKGWVSKPPLWDSLMVPRDWEDLDPRFDGSEDEVKEFKKTVYEMSQKLRPEGGWHEPTVRVEIEKIADNFNIHPDDVEDIIREKEAANE